MANVRTIARNVFSNFAGYFVSMVVGFLLTPYVLGVLGEEAWGFWQVVMAFTGSYGLLDLGIRSAVGYYVTRYWAKHDIEGINRTYSTALTVTGAIAVFLVTATATVAFVSPLLFETESIAPNDLRIVILIMGCGVALNFPLAIFGSAMYARQRFDIQNIIGISERLISAGAWVWVLEQGWGLIGVAAVAAIVPAVMNLVRLAIAFRLIPGLQIERSLVKLVSVKELFSYGFYNTFVNAAEIIVIHSDAFILGVVINSVAVAYYCGGSFPIGQCLAIVNAIAWTLTPYATQLDTRGDRQGLIRLWMTGTRVIVLVGALLAAGMVCLGHDFLGLWLANEEGEAMVAGVEYTSSATIMAILAGTVFIRAAMSCGKQILYGIREVAFLAKNSFTCAVLNVVLSSIAVFEFGLIGVATASVTSFALTQLWFQPRHLAGKLGIRRRDILLPIVVIPILVVATMLGMEHLVYGDGMAATWGEFVAKGFVLSIPAALVAILFGFSHVEKDKIRSSFARFFRGRDPYTGEPNVPSEDDEPVDPTPPTSS